MSSLVQAAVALALSTSFTAAPSSGLTPLIVAALLLAFQLRQPTTTSNVHAFTRVGGGRQGTLVVQCAMNGWWLAVNCLALTLAVSMSTGIIFLCVAAVQGLFQQAPVSKILAASCVAAGCLVFWASMPIREDHLSTIATGIGGIAWLLGGFLSESLRKSFVAVLCQRVKSDDEAPKDNDRIATFVSVASIEFAVLWCCVVCAVRFWMVEGFTSMLSVPTVLAAFLISPQLTDVAASPLVRSLGTIAALAVKCCVLGAWSDRDVLAAAAMLICLVAALATKREQIGAARQSEIDPSMLFGTQWNMMQSVYSNAKSRKLLTFLILNFLFMGVELATGIHENSLGLISDAIHMLMDSMSVAIGLYAAVMALIPPTDVHPFGRVRFEVISAFVNGVLLLLVACGTFVEALHRLYTPRSVNGLSLIPVSVGGLIVNLVGVAFFHEAHAHHGHSHSHGGHSHDESCHGHGEGCQDHGSLPAADSNLRGVYLHILADLLGSVSVICSSVIIHYTGFVRVDSICSLGVVAVILFAAKSLISESASILMLKAPLDRAHIESVREQLLHAGGVKSVPTLLSWINSPSGGELAVHCMVSVELDHTESFDEIRAKVSRLLIDTGCASSVDALTVEFS